MCFGEYCTIFKLYRGRFKFATSKFVGVTLTVSML